jgi:hypothetical protein
MDILKSNNPNETNIRFIYNPSLKNNVINYWDENVQKKIIEYVDYFNGLSLRLDLKDWNKFVFSVRDIISRWDPKDFLMEGRLPTLLKNTKESIKTVVDDWKFNVKEVNEHFLKCKDVCSSEAGYDEFKDQGVLDMPVKFCGTSVVLPDCLNTETFRYFIVDSIACELAIRTILEKNGEIYGHEGMETIMVDEFKLEKLNLKLKKDLQNRFGITDLDRLVRFNKRLYDDYQFYVTVNVSEVEVGKAQRNVGIHVDGFQGVKYPIKFENDHSYIFVNEGPTLFTSEPFNPPDSYDINWYEGEKGMSSLSESLQKGRTRQLVLMTGLQLHEAGTIPMEYGEGTKVGRFFYRGEFTLKEHNRFGNSINKAFGRFNHYMDRSIVTTLGLKDTEGLHGVDFGKN